MSVGYTKDTQIKPSKTKHALSSCQAPREVLSLVGDKWSVLIVIILKAGTKRFNELRHSIEGISQRMLTRTLRQLERDGLIHRKVEPTMPPSVYYTLTPLGQTLLVPVAALGEWAQVHYSEICAAREVFDAKNEHIK